jgi:hypothetical protein
MLRIKTDPKWVGGKTGTDCIAVRRLVAVGGWEFSPGPRATHETQRSIARSRPIGAAHECMIALPAGTARRADPASSP